MKIKELTEIGICESIIEPLFRWLRISYLQTSYLADLK